MSLGFSETSKTGFVASRPKFNGLLYANANLPEVENNYCCSYRLHLKDKTLLISTPFQHTSDLHPLLGYYLGDNPVSKPISNHHRSDIVQISARYRKRHRTAYRFAHRLKVGPISWRLHIGPISGGYRFSHRTDILPSLDRYSVYRLDILYDIGPISFCPLASSRTDID